MALRPHPYHALRQPAIVGFHRWCRTAPPHRRTPRRLARPRTTRRGIRPPTWGITRSGSPALLARLTGLALPCLGRPLRLGRPLALLRTLALPALRLLRPLSLRWALLLGRLSLRWALLLWTLRLLRLPGTLGPSAGRRLLAPGQFAFGLGMGGRALRRALRGAYEHHDRSQCRSQYCCSHESRYS
jgi:hypothetical protein